MLFRREVITCVLSSYIDQRLAHCTAVKSQKIKSLPRMVCCLLQYQLVKLLQGSEATAFSSFDYVVVPIQLLFGIECVLCTPSFKSLMLLGFC